MCSSPMALHCLSCSQGPCGWWKVPALVEWGPGGCLSGVGPRSCLAFRRWGRMAGGNHLVHSGLFLWRGYWGKGSAVQKRRDFWKMDKRILYKWHDLKKIWQRGRWRYLTWNERISWQGNSRTAVIHKVEAEGYITDSEGFLGGTSAKEPSCQCKRHPQVGKMPWARKWHLLQRSC